MAPSHRSFALMPPTEGSVGELQFLPTDGLDATVAAVCASELESFRAELARWGRFRQPVTLRTTEDRAFLRHAAGSASSELLCALATADSVLMLAPRSWAARPTHHDVYRALLHELAHVLLFQRCSPPNAQSVPAIPVWYREGMAAFVADGPPPPQRRREVAHRDDLLQLAGAGAEVLARHSDACYLVARLLFASWLQRHGDRRYAAICRAMRQRASFAVAHRRACSESPEAFLRWWVSMVSAEAKTV